MKRRLGLASLVILLGILSSMSWLSAQGRPADYERANGLREKFQALALDIPGRVVWIEKTHRFWYRKSVQDGFEFELVDADKLAKQPAFDHEKLAAALNAASGEKVKAANLPFTHFSTAGPSPTRSSWRTLFGVRNTPAPTSPRAGACS